MKVLALVILAISSAAAFRSGPYLPSGWRPQGPAFFLPGEEEKSAPKPEQESEPSGSDFLREYGPPKSEDLTRQYLPDVATEQTFFQIKGDGEKEAVIVEANAELKSTDQEPTAIIFTQQEESATTADDKSAEIKATEEINDITPSTQEITEIVRENPTTESLKIVEDEMLVGAFESSSVQEEESTEKILEAITEEKVTSDLKERLDEIAIENVNSVVSLAQQQLEYVENVVSSDIKTVAEAVENVNSEAQVEIKNIADAITNLENEVKAVQVESQQLGEVKVEENSGSVEQVPEGFLEYGPPGFREYGPPKEDIAEEKKIENNEARKRRFSPKFKATKHH